MKKDENQSIIRPRIKICGLMEEKDADAVNESGADYAGLIFAATRRRVSAKQAAAIRRRLNKEIPTVGVFVNHPVKEICRLAEEGVITMIQLHGDEPPEAALYLKEATGLPIIRAVRVAGDHEVKEAASYPCDYVLFDTFQAGSYGGTGKSFDWSLLFRMETPFFLAGGIGVDNYKEAAETGAFCLDVSSGVETNGKKDREKIKEMVRLVHGIVPKERPEKQR